MSSPNTRASSISIPSTVIKWEKRAETTVNETELSVAHPSTAGERSGLLLPLDRYLLWLCKREGRPCPQWSPAPSRPPIGPPRPAGTEPPIGPPPNPPRALRPPRRPPGSRRSESGVSPSAVNGRSSNRCHSYRMVGFDRGGDGNGFEGRDFETESGIKGKQAGQGGKRGRKREKVSQEQCRERTSS